MESRNNFITFYILVYIELFFCRPMPPHVLVDFVVLPPGHGMSVTDFWVWDAHEAQLRCPDDVSADRGRCSARRALKSKFYYPTQTMATVGIFPFRKNSRGTAGSRTRDLMISSQRLWPLDHEADRYILNCKPRDPVGNISACTLSNYHYFI